jgi:putative ATP-dependent endonuclease of OLD family
MGQIRQLRVQNFKSVKDTVELRFVDGVPLILVGPNNSGKSNLMRAMELVLGESWPGSYKPEDHDFHERDPDNIPLQITVEMVGVTHSDRYGDRDVAALCLRFPPDEDRGFFMIFGDGTPSRYVSTETREQCRSILISADRRLSYQLGYSTKYTFLSKLMRQFYQALKEDPERMAALQGKFVEVKELFQGVDPFRTFTDELQKQVAELSGNLEYRLGVDFSAYDPSNYFHALRVLPHQNDQVRTFEELGTGQEQILALSFAYAYAKAFHGQQEGLVLIIEEPEAHLHPIAQEWISRKIHELAKEDVQVVVTTHSPAFVSMLGLEGIALVRKETGATRVMQLSRQNLAEYCRSKGADAATAESILPFYAALATKEILSGFFARKVVLVEGPTEALALPIYFERIGLNTLKEGIAIISVQGVGNLAKWWRLFTAYRIPVYVAFDNDTTEDGKGEKRSDLLTAIGVPADGHKPLLNTSDWVVNGGFAVFGKNFEETMRGVFGPQYPELETEARDTFGLSQNQSKPLVARYVAERIPLGAETAPYAKFKSLSDAINALG